MPEIVHGAALQAGCDRAATNPRSSNGRSGGRTRAAVLARLDGQSIFFTIDF